MSYVNILLGMYKYSDSASFGHMYMAICDKRVTKKRAFVPHPHVR
jgi:hypothetical protein